MKGKEGCPQLVKESFPESEGEAPIPENRFRPDFPGDLPGQCGRRVERVWPGMRLLSVRSPVRSEFEGVSLQD